MKKLIYEMNSPSGDVLVDLREIGILKWVKYIANKAFHIEGVYEKFIEKLESDKENDNKILIIVNDNSDHKFAKRCYINFLTDNGEYVETN